MTEKPQPVVIDADAFDPVPEIPFRYRGEDYAAFNIIQIRASTREKVVRLNTHLAAQKTLDGQIAFVAEIITEFVPALSADRLHDEPFEKLLSIVRALARFGDSGGDDRPTKDQRKSGSRRTTRR